MPKIDIVQRLRYDAARCQTMFSVGIGRNIDAGADEIEKLRLALREVMNAKNDPYEIARNALGLAASTQQS